MIYQERRCRICQGELETILDLGLIYVSTFLRPDERPGDKVPHDLTACIECGLIQLRHTVDPETLYRQYWYKSGINEAMVKELKDIVRAAEEMVPVGEADIVVDIGANDGTLLDSYWPRPVRVAFEPAKNLYAQLRLRCDALIPDFFPSTTERVADGTAKHIFSIACFYDLDQPKVFVDAIQKALHQDGVWIVQFQDWDQMRRARAFDNICAEHLVYYTLGSFEELIEPFGLTVCDAEVRAINGGSYRLYVRHRGHPVTSSVDVIRQQETGCEDWDTLHQFRWQAEEAKRQILAAVEAELKAGHLVDLYGASTKANTLLQWCKLTKRELRWAWERSSEKFGLHTVGSDIPIVAETIGRSDPPQALLAGIWQFRNSIVKREADFLRERGSIIFPLPRVDVVTGRG